MTEIEFDDVKKQIDVIEGLIPKYGGKTIDNILYGLKCRVKEYIENNKKIKENERNN